MDRELIRDNNVLLEIGSQCLIHNQPNGNPQ